MSNENGSVIRKAATDAASAIDSAVSMLHERDAQLKKYASQIETLTAESARLKRQVEETPLKLDKEMLRKTASALYACCGEPSRVSVELIEQTWQKNPNTILGALHKIASEKLSTMVKGEGIGKVISDDTVQKRASAETDEHNDYNTAREIFMGK